jgi:hypothetical protein
LGKPTTILGLWLRNEFRKSMRAHWLMVSLTSLASLCFIVFMAISLCLAARGLVLGYRNGTIEVCGTGWDMLNYNNVVLTLWRTLAQFIYPYWWLIALLLAIFTLICAGKIARIRRIPEDIIVSCSSREIALKVLSHILKYGTLLFGIIYAYLTSMIILYKYYVLKVTWVYSKFWSTYLSNFSAHEIFHRTLNGLTISLLYSVAIFACLILLSLYWNSNRRTMIMAALGVFIGTHFLYLCTEYISGIEIALFLGAIIWGMIAYHKNKNAIYNWIQYDN